MSMVITRGTEAVAERCSRAAVAHRIDGQPVGYHHLIQRDLGSRTNGRTREAGFK
jgi:hypothetical protein